MSEYWVSHKRYHCKYCNIYIADDKPSRQQHENGLRHKGNVERFVRGLYKEGEKRVREREEEKGIMASVGKVGVRWKSVNTWLMFDDRLQRLRMHWTSRPGVQERVRLGVERQLCQRLNRRWFHHLIRMRITALQHRLGTRTLMQKRRSKGRMRVHREHGRW